MTGAGAGIGRATAFLLAEYGASIAVLDRNEEGCRATVAQIEHVGGRAAAFVVDLADAEAIPLVISSVIEWGHHVDILVNAAGIRGEQQELVELTLRNWDDVLDINLRAQAFLIKEIASDMVARGQGGRIVNVGSSAGFRAVGSFSPYATSKAGVSALTRVAAAELGPHGINVNAVAPGLTKTAMTAGLGDDDALREASTVGPLANFLHRPSEPEDVANAIAFLCLPQSRQITAQTIHTSTGWVL